MSDENFLTRIRAAEAAAEQQIAAAEVQSRQDYETARREAAGRLEAVQAAAAAGLHAAVAEAEDAAQQLLDQARLQIAAEVEALQAAAALRLPDAVTAVMERIVNDCARR